MVRVLRHAQAQAPAGDLEQATHGIPARTGAAHALAEGRAAGLACAHLTQGREHPLGAQWQGRAQALLEDRASLGREPQQHQEGALGAGLARALEDLGPLAVVQAGT